MDGEQQRNMYIAEYVKFGLRKRKLVMQRDASVAIVCLDISIKIIHTSTGKREQYIL